MKKGRHDLREFRFFCGEEYLSAETNRRLLHLAKDAKQRGVALELVKYAA